MAQGEVTVNVDGRRLRLSNLDKIMYPETGTTKAELIDYATRIAPVLIPHVAGRPVTRKRWPHGVGTPTDPQEPFFAKQLEPGAPSWIPTGIIRHSDGPKTYPLVAEPATLAWLTQTASLELHVPQWRFDAAGGRSNPDRLVLDLDPGPGAGLAECAAVASIARDLLEGMGLRPYPLTSGSKGIHLYAHVDGRQTSEQVSAVAHALARAIEADHPDLAVSSMSKAQRAGRVFIDWSQNNGKKTTIAPYSLRGTYRPTVAAPRTWDELADPGLRQLEFWEVLDRVARDGDLLAGLDRDDHRLLAYNAKRSAARTPEPMPDRVTADGTERRFVIQEHHASRLHWDLRLERGGVLVSWAVPKGLPDTSDRNNLAVQTEDHPIEYLGFAGDIPRGEYGAGRMWIWDAGTYSLEKWRDDEVIATLHGSPGGPVGDTRIVLVRTDGHGEKSTWLLRRMRTLADGMPQPPGAPVVARPDTDPVRDTQPDPRHPATPGSPRADGFLAGTGPEPQTGTAGDADPHANGDATRDTQPDPRHPATPGSSRADGFLADGGTATDGEPTDGAPAADRADDARLGFVAPMLAAAATPAVARATADRALGHEPWVEAKWDGIRAVGVWEHGALRLWARSGVDITDRYPELTAPGAVRFHADRAVLDGEIVALDAAGRPSFTRLQNRMHLTKPAQVAQEAKRTPVSWFLFDALHDDHPIAGESLHARRDALERIAKDAGAAVAVPPVFDDVDAALAAAQALDLEGVVVKDPRSPYRPGVRAETWLKVKLRRSQDVVIGGVRPGKDSRSGSLASLLVGVWNDDGTLHYAGRVGSGFSEAEAARLLGRLAPLGTHEDPFADVPAPDASDAVWVRPELVGEVEFAEWSPNGHLRHAVWRGLRADVPVEDVRRED